MMEVVIVVMALMPLLAVISLGMITIFGVLQLKLGATKLKQSIFVFFKAVMTNKC